MMASSSSSSLRFSAEVGGEKDADDTPDEVLPGDIPPSDNLSSRGRGGDALGSTVGTTMVGGGLW